MRKILLIIFIIILITVSLYHVILKGKKTITIAYTSDLQGFITPHEDTPIPRPALIGGSSYLATHVKRERGFAKWDNRGFFLVDTGNFFAGQAEGYFFKGSSVIEIMNKIGYDALVPGAKDFVFGEDSLRRLAKEAKFPFLSANVVKEDTGEIVDFLTPYIIKEYRRVKIGFIGITSPDIYPENMKGLKILDPILTVRAYVSVLKNMRVDLIVVLSNLGLEGDEKLAREISDINVIIGGNDPYIFRDPCGCRNVWPFYVDSKNRTVIVETTERGTAYYHINIILNHRGETARYIPKLRSLYAAEIQPDSKIQTIIEKYTEALKEKKKEAIGYCKDALMRSKDKESTLGSWVADILREKTKADIAFIGGLQADLKQGEIVIGDIYNILPIVDRLESVNFSLTTIELSGEEIKNILERSVGWALENSKFGILQVSGLKLAYDLNRPKDYKVVDVIIDSEKLDLNKIYKIAINGYLASGGDGYHDIITAKKRNDTGLMDFDVIAEYIKMHSPITAPPSEGRIVRLKEKNEE